MDKSQTNSSFQSTDGSNSSSTKLLLYSALLNKYNTVNGADNAVDSKCGVVLAASVTIAIFTVTDSTFSQSIKTLWLAASLLSSLYIVIATVLNIRPKKYRDVIGDEKQLEAYLKYEDDKKLYEILLGTANRSYEANEKILRAKVQWYNYTLYALIAQSFFAILYFLPTLYVPV